MENIPDPQTSNILARTRNFFRETWKAYAVLLPIAAFLIALDQWTKTLVRAHVPLGSDWLPSWLAWLMPYARIRHWHNTGAAFGLFQGGSLIFTILAILVAGLILYYFPRIGKDFWLRLALAMQFSGAIGNLIDRLRFEGRVTDFISVGNFAVFNVADSCITVGTAILLMGAYLTERSARKKAAAAAGQDEATSGRSD